MINTTNGTISNNTSSSSSAAYAQPVLKTYFKTPEGRYKLHYEKTHSSSLLHHAHGKTVTQVTLAHLKEKPAPSTPTSSSSSYGASTSSSKVFNSIAFSHDGAYLATVGRDGYLRVFDYSKEQLTCCGIGYPATRSQHSRCSKSFTIGCSSCSQRTTLRLDFYPGICAHCLSMTHKDLDEIRCSRSNLNHVETVLTNSFKDKPLLSSKLGSYSNKQ